MKTVRIALLAALLSTAAFAQDTAPPVSIGGPAGITGGLSLEGQNILTHMTDANYIMISSGWWAGTQIVPSSLTLTAARTITAPANPGQPYFFCNFSTGGFATPVWSGSGTPISVPNGSCVGMHYLSTTGAYVANSMPSGSGSVGTAGQVQKVGATAGSFAASAAIDNGTYYYIFGEPLYLGAETSNGTCATAATIAAANGNHQNVTLTNADTCALTFSQPAVGVTTLTLKIVQSATTPFSGAISGASVNWIGGVPTIPATASAVVFISCYLDSTNVTCQGPTASGTGTVTSVSVTSANGVSGTVATATTTPAITLALGAIIPSSVASTGAVSGTTVTASAGVTASSDGVHAGIAALAGNTTNPTIPTNQFGWLGFNTTSATSYFLQPSTTAPAGNYLQCGVPSGGVSTCVWATPAGSSPGGTTGAAQYNNAGALGGLNGTGLEYLNGASAPTIATTAQIQSAALSSVTTLSGTTPAVTLAGNGGMFTIILSGSTVPTTSGVAAGMHVRIQICQPSSGGPFTWTWPSAFHGGIVIGTTANTCSMQAFNSFNGTTLFPESTGVINVAP